MAESKIPMIFSIIAMIATIAWLGIFIFLLIWRGWPNQVVYDAIDAKTVTNPVQLIKAFDRIDYYTNQDYLTTTDFDFDIPYVPVSATTTGGDTVLHDFRLPAGSLTAYLLSTFGTKADIVFKNPASFTSKVVKEPPTYLTYNSTSTAFGFKTLSTLQSPSTSFIFSQIAGDQSTGVFMTYAATITNSSDSEITVQALLYQVTYNTKSTTQLSIDASECTGRSASYVIGSGKSSAVQVSGFVLFSKSSSVPDALYAADCLIQTDKTAVADGDLKISNLHITGLIGNSATTTA
jgi:hypothetical protein